MNQGKKKGKKHSRGMAVRAWQIEERAYTIKKALVLNWGKKSTLLGSESSPQWVVYTSRRPNLCLLAVRKRVTVRATWSMCPMRILVLSFP